MAEAGGLAAPQVDTRDPVLAACVAAFGARFGASLAGIVLYGSYLRGKRDTVLDFYLLLDDYHALPGGWPARIGNRLLPPNVYHLQLDVGGRRIAAKYACITLRAFERAIAFDFTPYFWARFTQPCALVLAREHDLPERLAAASWTAGRRLLGATLPMLPTEFTTAQAWQRAFALTYGCELRSEPPAGIAELCAHYAEHLERLFGALVPALGLARGTGTHWRHASGALARWRARAAWALRRALGKALSVARLLKAAFTFNDVLDYVLWKVERHSGVRVEASARERRHPLLFGWGVLWRLYRQGGFR